jgi:hypothetical protein
MIDFWRCDECGEYNSLGRTNCSGCGTAIFNNNIAGNNTVGKCSEWPTLDNQGAITEALQGYAGNLVIVIERHGQKMLDDDNFIAGCKQLRDAIAEACGRSGDSEKDGLKFEYLQVKAKHNQMVIKIYKPKK